MGFGGALNFNGECATLAAGFSVTAVVPIQFPCILKGSPCNSNILAPVSFSYELPPIETEYNVTVNGFKMTKQVDGFGALKLPALGEVEVSCNPAGGFSVDVEQSISNVTINGINAAIPDVPPAVAAIPALVSRVNAEALNMKTTVTNVMLSW